MAIIVIDEHQNLKNDHVCSFCEDENKHVVGRAYAQNEWDFPLKHYLFSYCQDCGLRQADKMAKVIHPDHEVR